MGRAAVELEVGGVVGLAVRSEFADLLAVLHQVGLNKMLHKKSSSKKRSRVSKKSGMQSVRTTRGFSCRVRYMRPKWKGSGQRLLVMSFNLWQRSSVLIREVQMRVGSRGPGMSQRRCTRRWKGRIRAWSKAATKSVGRIPSCSSLATL